MRRGTQAIRRVSNATKRIVAYRYEYKCAKASCRVVLPPTWECDHIVPLWKILREPQIWTKDPNHLSNLQPLCPSCHRKKTLRETLEQERLRRNDQADYSDEESYGEDSLDLDEMLQIQDVTECKREKPIYDHCPACNLRYSPYFTHACQIPKFHAAFDFDPDRANK
jgi:hypothetical protein